MKVAEILAPAGDFSCLVAAFNAGADAVYLAGKSYGARAFANNFSEEELVEALDYAHMLSKKIYLTLNTLIKESEFASIVSYLTPYYEHGLDGIIIQDLGLIPLLKKHFPLLELHASTQMTVNNYRSAAWLKEKGICRVVPSREMSLLELKEIKEKAGIEVEAFIHGAMCYGYSGQCLFSSFLGGRSGNRGRCAQPCRLPYQVLAEGKSAMGNKEIYPLSLKDLCSLPYIYELLDAGIDSFKIEGRMKSPEYVAGVTSIYRKYVDYYKNGKRPAIDKADLEQLNHLYIRSEIKDGYLKKHNGKDMVSLSSPSYQGCDDTLVEAIHEKYCVTSQKLPVSGVLSLIIGEPALLTVSYKDETVVVYGNEVQTAQNRPLLEEDVRKQMNKTGNSMFEFERLHVEMSDSVFMPVKQLNELRRNALIELQNCLLSSYMRNVDIQDDIEENDVDYDAVYNTHHTDRKGEKENKPSLRISVYDENQVNAIMNSDLKVERIYVPADLFYTKRLYAKDIINKGKKRNIKVYLSMPRIIRKRDDAYLQFVKEFLHQFDGILVKNLESISFLTEEGYDGAIITDTMLYNWNQSALDFLNHYRQEFSYPLELSFREIKALENTNGEYVIYGRTPMMVSANCIRNTTDGCQKNANAFSQSLKDRYRKVLPVYTNCVHCYNEIYNAVTMSLHKEIPQLIKNDFSKFRMDFTTENVDEMLEMVKYYSLIMKNTNNNEVFPMKEFTSGHFKEGAE